MALPSSMTQVTQLSQEYQNFLNAYYNMMSAAAQFVNAGNVLAADSTFLSVASSAFKTWGSANITTVSNFISNSTTPPPA